MVRGPLSFGRALSIGRMRAIASALFGPPAPAPNIFSMLDCLVMLGRRLNVFSNIA
jgi:hypothetical protein